MGKLFEALTAEERGRLSEEQVLALSIIERAADGEVIISEEQARIKARIDQIKTQEAENEMYANQLESQFT